MLIAHLPAGYLVANILPIGRSQKLAPAPQILMATMVGSMFPDIDMLAFLFWDQGQFHHHDYWLHIPFFWLLVGSAIWMPLGIAGPDATFASRVKGLVLAFGSGIFLHLLLDSYAAPIRWFLPLSDIRIELIHVPATHSHWILSMVLHWSFLAELAIWMAAISCFLWKRNGSNPTQ